MKRSRTNCGRKAFTLLEILLASIAAVIVLVAIYGVFMRAIKMRDNATAHVRDSRAREHAANVLGNDLRNALISGTNGVFAVVLEGGRDGSKSSFPGYLSFTTTTGKDSPDAMYGDVQQVEYYIASDTKNNAASDSGTLVRSITRDLLASVQDNPREEQILSGVKSLDVSFFDGQNWQPTWQYSTDNPAIPQAVRVDVELVAASPKDPSPQPLEILVPWNTQPWTSGTATTTGT